jgi:phosphomannomutase
LLFEKVGPHYYDRIDSPALTPSAKRRFWPTLPGPPGDIGGLKVTDIVTIDGHQFIMEDGGWLLVRFSGTEPIIRVYCETTHGDRVADILADGMRIAGLKA